MEDQIPNKENTEAIISQINGPKKKLRHCPYCNSMYEIKSPFKNLFRMPTLNEWIVLFMLVMLFVISWAYKHDTAVCRDYVNNIDKVCLSRNLTFIKPTNYSSYLDALKNITIVNTGLTNVTNVTT